MPHAILPRGHRGARWSFLLGAIWLTAPALSAQEPTLPPVTVPPDLKRDPVLPRDLNLDSAPAGVESPARPHRFRLFRIQPGFLSDPVGLDQDDPALPDGKVAESDGGLEWISVALGNDNPFFDMRQRGDPGGVGFYRVNTQVQLFDTATTACTLALQAYAPAGLQFDGLPDRAGPTVVSPALSLFHALEDGTALQGFVGKHLPLANAATGPLQRAVQYGMALQRPLGPDTAGALNHFYLYVGALGQYRLDRDSGSSQVVWDVMPGLHWKVADNWWVTGGMILPVGSARSESVGQWQVTCSVQF
jgi:hypothetical protein